MRKNYNNNVPPAFMVMLPSILVVWLWGVTQTKTRFDLAQGFHQLIGLKLYIHSI